MENRIHVLIIIVLYLTTLISVALLTRNTLYFSLTFGILNILSGIALILKYNFFSSKNAGMSLNVSFISLVITGICLVVISAV